jgi:hypothetical protein
MSLEKICLGCGEEVDGFNLDREKLCVDEQVVREEDFCTACLERYPGVIKIPDKFILVGAVTTRVFL